MRIPEGPLSWKIKYSIPILVFPIVGVISRAQGAVGYGFAEIGSTSLQAAPAINNNGLVAFVGSNGAVDTGSGGSATFIGQGQGAAYGVWINDSGQVAFRNSPPLGVTSAVRGSGGPITIIGSDIGTLPVISDNGTVTYLNGTFDFFSQGLATVGISSGSGGALTTILPTAGSNVGQFTSEYEALAVSHNGTLTYEKYPSASATTGQSIIINRAGVETVFITLPTAPSDVSFVNSVSVNNQGMVAMTGELSSQHGIFVGDGTSLTQFISDTTPVRDLGNASINDSDEIAFLGSYTTSNGSINGIFTGPDPVADGIIQTGDALEGSTVTQLLIGTDALNDNGEVVFWAQLANGTSGIFTATPVPEPASLSVTALGSLSLLLRRRKPATAI